MRGMTSRITIDFSVPHWYNSIKEGEMDKTEATRLRAELKALRVVIRDIDPEDSRYAVALRRLLEIDAMLQPVGSTT